jgi:hypothetical protein
MGVVDRLEEKELVGNELARALDVMGEKACRLVWPYEVDSPGVTGLAMLDMGSPPLNIDPSRLFRPGGTAAGIAH